MKKIFVCFIALVLMVTCVACGTSEKKPSEKDSNILPSTSENDSTEDTKLKSNSISMEELLNHKESPDTDFFCTDDGNGGLVLMEYLGNDEIVVIPEKIDGKPIKSITKYVFANDCSVKAIKLSNSIEEISDFAFALNKNLQLVVCGNGLQTIGKSAFQACESLREISLPEGLKIIKSLAFSQCRGLNSVTIPSSVETIEVIAFNLMSDDFTLIGDADGVAESYAKSESINFKTK